MEIVLFYPKTNKIIETNDTNILDNMYDELAVIPSIEQFKSYKNINDLLKKNKAKDITDLITLYKQYISKLSFKIPLFDYNTKNIYLVEYEDVYQKVTQFNYRFPNKKIIDLLKNTLNDLMGKQISGIEWISKYIKKLNKNIDFLNNFDLSILKQTYYDAF